MSYITKYQKDILIAMSEMSHSTTIGDIAKLVGRPVANVRSTLRSLVSKHYVSRRGAMYKLLKHGRVALLASIDGSKLEAAVGLLSIDEIDELSEASTTKLATMFRNAKYLPQKAIRQLAKAVEKHSGEAPTIKSVGIYNKQIDTVEKIIGEGDCVLYSQHATAFMEVDPKTGDVFGSGMYSQHYLKRNDPEKKVGVKYCAIKIHNDEMKSKIGDYIESHPEKTINDRNENAQLRIRFVNPVFRQVQIAVIKGQPKQTFLLESVDTFHIHNPETDER